jgi:tetratricopeptide (TPR) repeat protein
LLLSSHGPGVPLCHAGRIILLRRNYSTVLSLLLGVVLLVLPLRAVAASSAGTLDLQVCDPVADLYLGIENYPEAIQRHLVVIQEHPENALAYYHLGFAYGMVGDRQRELADYQKAVALGLSDWDLFLNMGLVYMESGRLDSASQVLQLAALLGPYRPETHFNLGLLDERLGMYQKAAQEVLLSLRIDPNQNDARNMLGVIYAEQGNFERAHQEWADLIKSNPGYAPARANLQILDRIERGEIDGPARLSSGFAEVH